MDEPRDLLFHEWPMFNQVMTNEHDICRRLLEVVLGEPVDRVRNVEVERTVEPRLGAKGVRLDAFASTANAVYDVEIQAYTMKELGRRMRYYQSAMDSSALRRGQPYRNLAESYVVFICTEDQFDAALPVYHFEMVCCEDEAVDLRSGVPLGGAQCFGLGRPWRRASTQSVKIRGSGKEVASACG